MTKLQKENLEHTQANVAAARTRFAVADTKAKEAKSSLEFAQKKDKEAQEELSRAGAALSLARTRFFDVVDDIEPLESATVLIDHCSPRHQGGWVKDKFLGRF